MSCTDEQGFVDHYLKFIRRRITELRIAKGVYEREMSFALGKSSAYINHIVSGTNIPYFDNFLEICDYFGVSPEEFFAGEDITPAIEHEYFQLLSERCDGEPERFMAILKKMKPEHMASFIDFIENV